THGKRPRGNALLRFGAEPTRGTGRTPSNGWGGYSEGQPPVLRSSAKQGRLRSEAPRRTGGIGGSVRLVELGGPLALLWRGPCSLHWSRRGSGLPSSVRFGAAHSFRHAPRRTTCRCDCAYRHTLTTVSVKA